MRKENMWNRLRNFLKTHVSLTVIIVAALLLELTTGVMYYSAHSIIQRAVNRLVQREMDVVCLSIGNRLDGVEVSVADKTWLDSTINEGKAYKGTQRFLVTADGHLLAGPDNATFRAALQLLQADGYKADNATITDERGDKLLVFFRPVNSEGNRILINILNDNEVFGKLRRMRLFILLMGLTGLLLTGFIVWRTSRNLERLRRVDAERARMNGELHVASKIQQSMLPREEVGDERLAVSGFLKPAREVGGDLYDYFIRDEKLFFCIGDVSGKGAPSAMFMAVAHALFRSASAHEDHPARIMQTVNETTCQGNESNMFVTLFIGVLDLPTGRLCYCNAGHDAPVILRDESLEMRVERLAVKANLPIGIFAEYNYEMQETTIESGSTLFLYTDGLTEAMNKAHEQFGMQHIEAVLGTCADRQPKSILTTVIDAVHGFVKDAEQSDDLTLLAIHYKK